MKRTRSIVSIFVCLVGIWLTYVEVMNLITWHFAQEFSRDHPNLGILPQPLSEGGVAKVDGETIEQFGFSFQVPWKNIAKRTDARTISLVSFAEGIGVLIFDPTTESNTVEIMRGKTAQQERLMLAIFGPEVLASNYNFMSYEVRTDPSQIKWWRSRSVNGRNLIMLTDKSLDIRKSSSIYELHCGDLRGFQFGNPNTEWETIQLDLFDKSDRHYKIVITRSDRSPLSVLSQAEINAIVASLRPIFAHSAVMSPSNGV